MKFRVTDKSLNNYGKEYEVKVIGRYINGYMTEYKGEQGFIENRVIKVLEIRKEEAEMPISL